MRFWNGYYWCRRMGVMGQGLTMEEAWLDMWKLYGEAVKRPVREFVYQPMRA